MVPGAKNLEVGNGGLGGGGGKQILTSHSYRELHTSRADTSEIRYLSLDEES